MKAEEKRRKKNFTTKTQRHQEEKARQELNH